jgi:hypothetical protein
MLIRELPNTPDYPLRALAELRRKESGNFTNELDGAFTWFCKSERMDFWSAVNKGQRPDIPAASIEDLRKAGMMSEPEPVIKDFARVDTAPQPPAFYCNQSESTAGTCIEQCPKCDLEEQAARKHNDALTNGTFVPPSITLEDYARMEREEEAITNPAHYKVCEGLEVMDIIRAVLTPEQLRGHYIATIIAYRMRAGKKTMSPMEDLGKAHVYEQWLAEMEGG